MILAGLERLIVIGVGLDRALDPSVAAADRGALQTRSRLYRAMTRAQMKVSIVNEFVTQGRE